MVTAPSSAREVSVGLALHADEGLRAATHRLFEAGSVEAVSWSFEGGLARVPTWLRGLLDCYGAHGRLTLHGVAMSPLTARPHAASRRTWLAQLEECATRLHAAQVSEHFGFCAAGEVAFGAPLPVPWSRAALAAGRRALSELASASGGAPGLENLALSWCAHDARHHGAFLTALTDAQPSAYLVLDLHNLICQATTFGVEVDELLASYPLARVSELHVAGGRMVSALPGTPPVRRDTHDAPLSDDVLALVPRVLARCRNARFVFLERLPGTLHSPLEQARFAADYARLVAAVRSSEAVQAARSPRQGSLAVEAPIADDAEQLDALQTALLGALTREPSARAVQRALLSRGDLAPYHAWIDAAEERMLETARELVHRWSRVRTPERCEQVHA